MYGQSFTLEDPKSNGLNAKAKGPGEAGEFTRQGGFLSFYEVCLTFKKSNRVTINCNTFSKLRFVNILNKVAGL